MDIQPQTQTSATSSAGATAPARAEDDSVITSDFETFLRLLTTQLENQDPLNPLDSSEFAVQLATFSSVEQQVKTNDLLRDLTAGFGASGLTQLAGWVGMEARVTAPALFEGSPITLAPEVDPASDAATLVVRNEFGSVVSREGMPTNADTLLWAGTGADGQPLPSGTYSFTVESLNQGEITSVKPVAHFARVVEARTGPNGIDIVLAGGEVIAADTVGALRQPAAQPL